MVGVLTTMLGGVDPKSVMKIGKWVFIGLLSVAFIASYPITWYSGVSHGREELALELADAAGESTERKVRENVQRAEKAVTAISEAAVDLAKERKEFEDAVANSDECSCRGNADELRKYNEIIDAANRGDLP